MRNFLGVCAIAVGLFIPLSSLAQDRRPEDRDRNPVYDQSPNRWQGRLSAEDQSRFDSYYSRWLDYGQNDRRNQNNMEDRMRDVMSRYNIPSDVSFEQIASNRDAAYRFDGRQDLNRNDYERARNDHRRGYWQNRMSAKDQRRFDSYYTRWMDAERNRDRRKTASMERRMRDLMGRYSIPLDARFSEIASVSAERY